MISKNDFSGRYYERQDEVPWCERPHWVICFIAFAAMVLLFGALMFGVIK